MLASSPLMKKNEFLSLQMQLLFSVLVTEDFLGCHTGRCRFHHKEYKKVIVATTASPDLWCADFESYVVDPEYAVIGETGDGLCEWCMYDPELGHPDELLTRYGDLAGRNQGGFCAACCVVHDEQDHECSVGNYTKQKQVHAIEAMNVSPRAMNTMPNKAVSVKPAVYIPKSDQRPTHMTKVVGAQSSDC
jgi:hypothetical protein